MDSGKAGPGVGAGERAPRSEPRLRPPRPSASSRLLPPRPSSSSPAGADHQLPHGALEPRERHVATGLGQLHDRRTEHNQIKATLTFKLISISTSISMGIFSYEIHQSWTYVSLFFLTLVTSSLICMVAYETHATRWSPGPAAFTRCLRRGRVKLPDHCSPLAPTEPP